MKRLAMILGVLLPASSLADECLKPFPVEALTERLASIDRAFADGDPDQFLGDVDQLGLSLGCLSGVPSSTDIAHLHRVYGLVLWLQHDENGSRSALMASKRVDPEGVLNESLVPEGHPYRVLWDTVTPDEATALVGEPEQGRVYFDGVVTLDRPTESASLFQLEQSGELVATRWALPSAVLPDYAAKPIPLPKESLVSSDLVLGAASGGTAAAAIGMFAGAVLARRTFYARYGPEALGDDTSFSETDVTDATALQQRNNRLLVGAGASGVVALGLGVAVVAF